MSIQETKLTSIADAIREKEGSTGVIPANDFAERIRGIRGIELVSIAITSPPAKTSYYAGETFDPTGMVVTGRYSNGNVSLSGIVTGYTVSPAGALAAGTTKVVITYGEGGVTATAEQAISVVKRTATVPTQSGSLTYNGQPQTPVWTGYNSRIMAKTETARTEAGSSSTVFWLRDTARYQWSDGTTTSKTVAWSIAKAAGSLTLDKTAITLNASATSGVITVTRAGDGAISASSSDTGVATVSVDQNTGKVTIRSVDSKTGTATITVKVAAGTNHTAPADKTISVTAKFTMIYGVEWDWTSSGSTRGVRTDLAAGFPDPNPAVNNGTGSSPFDNIMPWSGMVKETRTGGVMVKEPKYWFKWTKTGKKLKLQIASEPVEGFHVDPVNMDRGDGLGEVDFSYIGRYHCADGWKSTTNRAPFHSTRSNSRTQIHRLGANIWQVDFAQFWYIGMLFLVEFADWNGERVGTGGTENGSSRDYNGKTDAMQYHTGTAAASRDTYGYTQYRNIENWWGNVYNWIDGGYYDDNGLNVILNPSKYSDNANGVLVGKPVKGYPSDFAIPTQSGLEWALYPSAGDGSGTTYVPDQWVVGNSTKPCLYCGTAPTNFPSGGPFRLGGTEATDAWTGYAPRLWERPPKTA